MKERSILFSGAMVHAILQGRKTQTRRVITKFPLIDDLKELPTWCPYGHPGDRLWVKETYRFDGIDPKIGMAEQRAETLQYRADGDDELVAWRPSIFMPRWASRIALEVTAVRVERLQAISTADARAEGFPYDGPQPEGARIRWYRDLWNGLNAKRGMGWDVNPWVWVIEFRRGADGDARRQGTPD